MSKGYIWAKAYEQRHLCDIEDMWKHIRDELLEKIFEERERVKDISKEINTNIG